MDNKLSIPETRRASIRVFSEYFKDFCPRHSGGLVIEVLASTFQAHIVQLRRLIVQGIKFHMSSPFCPLGNNISIHFYYTLIFKKSQILHKIKKQEINRLINQFISYTFYMPKNSLTGHVGFFLSLQGILYLQPKSIISADSRSSGLRCSRWSMHILHGNGKLIQLFSVFLLPSIIHTSFFIYK